MRRLLFVCLCSASGLFAACGNTSTSDTGRVGGGQITVLLDAGYAGSWPAGLDPATNTTARANLSLMNAIFGGLFQLTVGEDGSPAVEGVLASGYELLDAGRTIRIHLRENVTFSDGTPFNAEAVKFNIERNLKSPCTCTPTGWPWIEGDRTSVLDEHTVDLHFSRPYGAAVNAFPIANINWVASPTALQEMPPEEFRLRPVGAGPFKAQSFVLATGPSLPRPVELSINQRRPSGVSGIALR
jgi:peptide/nickel transport system substrate-binding protein